MKTLLQKSKKTMALVFALCLSLTSAIAQPPQKFSYQAVARNASGVLLVSETIGVKISICTDDAGSNVVYSQEQLTATNPNGLLTIEVGGDATFSSINWGSGSYWIKTEIDPDGLVGGTVYSITGISQLLSVPYALNAGGGSWMTNGNDIYNGNSGNVGIGISNPINKLEVGGNLHMDGNPIFLRADHTDRYDVIRWNSAVDMVDIGGAAGVNLGRGDGSGGVLPDLSVINGNVGIGTTSPTEKLEVVGKIKSNSLLIDGFDFAPVLEVMSTHINPVNIRSANTINTMGFYTSNGYKGFIGTYMGNSSFDVGTVGSNLSGDLNLVTRMIPRVTVNAVGLVGIRTTTPSADLHILQSDVATSGFGGANFDYNGDDWKIYHSGLHFSFANEGVRYAYVEDNTGNWITTSDKNLKTNIRQLPSVLENIGKLNPVTYSYKSSSDPNIMTYGFLAQEVKDVFPDLVRYTEEGTPGLSYSLFSVLSIKAIQEQQAQIDELKKQIQELKANK